MQGKWWQIFLIIVFLLGLILCAMDFDTAKSQTASTQLQSPREPDEWDIARVALQDIRNFFGDIGALVVRAATRLAQSSRTVLGYLTCAIILVIPLGVWALLNLRRVLGISNVRVSVSSSNRD